MTNPRRRVIAAFFAIFLLALTAPVTSAHAALETSDPVAGGTIASPYVLVFRFDEALKSDGSSVGRSEGRSGMSTHFLIV